MTDHVPSPLGRCPRCDVRVSRRRLLIEYERSDEEYRIFASCPNCETVVTPR
ncbi:DUF7837 family putative zinc-binding protein [Haloplanus rubicundus]